MVFPEPNNTLDRLTANIRIGGLSANAFPGVRPLERQLLADSC